MHFLDSIFVTYFTLSQYFILILSIFLSISTLSFMISQLITCECLCTSFFLVFAEEFYLSNHIFQNGIYFNILRMVSVTVRASKVLMFPTVDAGSAKKLVLKTIALNRLPFLCDYFITNTAENNLFDVCDIFNIHNPGI